MVSLQKLVQSQCPVIPEKYDYLSLMHSTDAGKQLLVLLGKAERKINNIRGCLWLSASHCFMGSTEKVSSPSVGGSGVASRRIFLFSPCAAPVKWQEGTYIFLYHFFFFFFFLAVLGLLCCTRAFSSCGERGLLFIVVRGLLIAVASLIAEHGL